MLNTQQIRKYFVIACILGLFVFNQSQAGDCGSKEGRLNQVAGTFIIPNKFPPDSIALQNLVTAPGGLASCQVLFGGASLSPACSVHDDCYGTSGANKGDCDTKLRQDWEASCNSQYRNRFRNVAGIRVAYPDNPARTACREACVVFVTLMSEAQTVNDHGFCPSCDAFNAAQQ
jgi:hypothetical protein